MVAYQKGHLWASGGAGVLQRPFAQALFGSLFGDFWYRWGQILALISLILEPDLVTFLSFFDAAGGQIPYVNP